MLIIFQLSASYTRSLNRANRGVKRPKWHLGIRSQSRPQDIMAEIFRKLKALEFQWKIITPYFIRCRYEQCVYMVGKVVQKLKNLAKN